MKQSLSGSSTLKSLRLEEKKKEMDKIYIKGTNNPDFDYVIDYLIDLADKINEIIDRLNENKR